MIFGRPGFFALVALYLISGFAFADDFEDGIRFYASKNYSQAAGLFKKAADQGNAQAEYNLGIMYAKGEGMLQDYQQAYFWLHKAADKGIGGAEYNLAIMYDNGLGVDRDYPVAAFWYRKAIQHGVTLANFNLGVMYDNGLGIAQDYSQAASLYLYAADRDVAQAQYNLAILYESGLGVAKNYAQAAVWYHRASELGISQAQTALTDMLNRGLVVPGDYQQADTLPNKAIEQEIVATIKQWAKLWSEKDAAGYLEFYAESFITPKGISFPDWKVARQTSIAKPKFIEVSFSDPKIMINDESHVIAQFKQNYRSSLIRDATAKTLLLTKLNGKWLIESEEAKSF